MLPWHLQPKPQLGALLMSAQEAVTLNCSEAMGGVPNRQPLQRLTITLPRTASKATPEATKDNGAWRTKMTRRSGASLGRPAKKQSQRQGGGPANQASKAR